MFAQLMLMQTFVDDLLDLKQIREGIFSLSNEVFDLSVAIELVCSVFDPQASSVGVKIVFEKLS